MLPFSFAESRKVNFISVFSYICLAASGLLLGILLALFGRADSGELIRRSVTVRPNVIMLFARSLLPLFITYLAVNRNNRLIVCLCVFCKCFLLAFSICAVRFAFPQAGWLVQLLLLWVNCLSFGIYHWVWFRYLVLHASSKPVDYAFCGFLLLISFFIDFIFVCPFTAMLFTKM